MKKKNIVGGTYYRKVSTYEVKKNAHNDRIISTSTPAEISSTSEVKTMTVKAFLSQPYVDMLSADGKSTRKVLGDGQPLTELISVRVERGTATVKTTKEQEIDITMKLGGKVWCDERVGKDVKMVWCAKGGNNSNSVFEYLDYNVIKNNPKIVCGYSDITSLTNMIFSKTGLVTFSGTNFKTIATDETDYSYKEIIKRFVEGSLEIGKEKSGYKTIKDGSSEGELIGGNLSLTKGLVDGKYKIDFTDKILFLEDLGYESEPAFISNSLYYMRQNKVFDKIKGIWLGNYEHESGITLEKILLDVIENDYTFPIIKQLAIKRIQNQFKYQIGFMY